MTDSTPPLSAPRPNRLLSLDALRGVAILTMVLSGVVPRNLPAWMYHAQVPPPDFTFDASVPGLTWVDLVFPLFLFSMGAAFPLALSRRLKKGGIWTALRGIVERGFLLGSFAIFLNHIRPYSINSSPTLWTWFQALFGFILLFPMFARWPEKWNLSPRVRRSIRIAGWTVAAIYLFLFRNGQGQGFDPNNRDIIIVILTNVAVFGSLVWLISMRNIILRLMIMFGIIAANLSAQTGGWIAEIWHITLIPYYIHAAMISYLLIAIPGTIVGDLLLKWNRMSQEEKSRSGVWSSGRLRAILFLMLSFVVVSVVGLQARWVQSTMLICLFLAVVGGFLVKCPGNETESLIRRLFGWGIGWLTVGMIFEPYQDGIKKDPATFSYYFVTAGLSIFLLIALLISIDVLKKQNWCRILVANGQNPMIAYVAVGNLILPVMNLTRIGPLLDRLTPGAWLGTGRALFVTLLVALTVWFFTRKKIFWRT